MKLPERESPKVPKIPVVADVRQVEKIKIITFLQGGGQEFLLKEACCGLWYVAQIITYKALHTEYLAKYFKLR